MAKIANDTKVTQTANTKKATQPKIAKTSFEDVMMPDLNELASERKFNMANNVEQSTRLNKKTSA